MPYQSKADRERAQWMTLREALTHIGKAERCTLKAALRQLGEAIADREIDARWPHALHLSGDWDEDLGPPRDIRFWKSARFILAGGGRILDDPACRTHHVRLQLIREGKLHYRRVLIRRDDVERIWPAREARAREQVDIRRKQGRPTARDTVWKTMGQMRDESYNLTTPQLRLAELVAERNSRKLGDKGWSERTIIEHVSDWLKKNGFGPSNC